MGHREEYEREMSEIRKNVELDEAERLRKWLSWVLWAGVIGYIVYTLVA